MKLFFERPSDEKYFHEESPNTVNCMRNLPTVTELREKKLMVPWILTASRCTWLTPDYSINYSEVLKINFWWLARALHVADLGSILGTPYGHPTLQKWSLSVEPVESPEYREWPPNHVCNILFILYMLNIRQLLRCSVKFIASFDPKIYIISTTLCS